MTETEKRKLSHIRICAEKNVQARSVSTGFEDVFLVHRALPGISLQEIDTSIDFFGHKLSAPIVIEAMTGGTREATDVNAALAEAAETLGLAMGVGSQRAAIEDSNLENTFRIAREKAPHAFLIANLGAPQLSRGYGLRDAQKAIDMIDADALAIHLNPLQEAVQPEGDTSYRGVAAKIEEIATALTVPVIVKETGAGIAAEEAEIFEGAGVRGIDVGGAGGTSWAAVEYLRAKETKDLKRERLGETFWNWGIPTAASIVEVCQSTKLTVIASGGIRTGIDVTKAIALGADAVGLALPLLKPALEGPRKVIWALHMLINELKTAMFLTGAKGLQSLKSSAVVITGSLADWLRVRGFEPEKYARRGH